MSPQALPENVITRIVDRVLDKLFPLIVKIVEEARLAYSIPRFAAAVDLGETTIKKAIADGDLTVVYPALRKPLITKAEGERWLASLPSERPQS